MEGDKSKQDSSMEEPSNLLSSLQMAYNSSDEHRLIVCDSDVICLISSPRRLPMGLSLACMSSSQLSLIAFIGRLGGGFGKIIDLTKAFALEFAVIAFIKNTFQKA